MMTKSEYDLESNWEVIIVGLTAYGLFWVFGLFAMTLWRILGGL